MNASLKAAKDQVHGDLIAGRNIGVVGVGIDPGGGGGSGSLELFYSDRILADAIVFNINENFGVRVNPRAGEIPVLPLGWLVLANRGVRDFFGNLMHPQLSGRLDPASPVTLLPRMKICQQGQEAGRLGCFVKLADGSVHALTARHLFTDDSAEIHSFDGFRAKDKIGNSLKLSSLNSVNSSECARFKPIPGAVFLGDNKISGGFIPDKTDMSVIEGKKVRCLSSGAVGVVLEIEGTIMYPLPASPSARKLFDLQVFVKNAGAAAFGGPGDSGSLVVLEEKAGSFNVGDAIGLYTWASGMQKYHFVTPFYDCVSQLGIVSIPNPP